MKKTTSLVLALVLLLSMFVLPASAGDAEEVYVCGVRVSTADTTYWVTDHHGGITSVGATAANAMVTYYAESNTLALKNATLSKTGTFSSSSDIQCLIYSYGDLTLAVNGECYLNPNGISNTSCYGIYVVRNGFENGELYINGEGSLSVLGGLISTADDYNPARAVASFGIFAESSIFFQGPDVSCDSQFVSMNNPAHSGEVISIAVATGGGSVFLDAGTLSVAHGSVESKSTSSILREQPFNRVPVYDADDYTVIVSSGDGMESPWDGTSNLLGWFYVQIKQIEQLDLVTGDVQRPTAGRHPSTTASINNPNVIFNEIRWYYNGEEMASTAYFRPLELYTCYIDIAAFPGYVFSADTIFGLNAMRAEVVDISDGGTEATISISFLLLDDACLGDETCPSNAFTDVPAPSDWSHVGIDYCVERGLFQGISATTFAPRGNMTRAMLVAVLYRMEGSVPQTGMHGFTDVPTDDDCWYRDAVTWASKNNVVSGIGDGKFAPNAYITREQIASILYRYAKIKGYDTSDGVMLAGFMDHGDVSGWASQALSWAVAVDLLAGTTNGLGQRFLKPLDYATRAEVAAFIMRFLKLPQA